MSKREKKEHPIGYKALAIVRHFYPAVTKVRDADDPVFIEVSDKDVKTSHRKDHNECAFAVACKRQEGLQGVIIAKSTAYLVKQRVAIRYEVPGSVAKEIVSFDRGSEFLPGSYSLRPFSKGTRLGERH